jgi:hypothetical protein
MQRVWRSPTARRSNGATPRESRRPEFDDWISGVGLSHNMALYKSVINAVRN